MKSNLILQLIGAGLGLASMLFFIFSPSPKLDVTIPINYEGAVFTYTIPYSSMAKEPRFNINGTLASATVLKQESRRVFLDDGTPGVELRVLLKNNKRLMMM